MVFGKTEGAELGASTGGFLTSMVGPTILTLGVLGVAKGVGEQFKDKDKPKKKKWSLITTNVVVNNHRRTNKKTGKMSIVKTHTRRKPVKKRVVK